MKISSAFHPSPTISSLAVLILIPASVYAATASTPIDYDFGTGSGQTDINATGSDFTTTINNVVGSNNTGDGQFNTLSSSLQMVNTVNEWSNMSATVATDLNAASQSNFTVSSTIELVDMGGNFSRLGFTFFGDGGDSLAAVFLPNNGSIRLTSGLNNDLSTNFALEPLSGFTAGATYTLKLTATFLGNGDLAATFSVDEVGGDEISGSVSHTFDAADIPTGNEFGLVGRIRNGSDAEFFNLSIIPEPSTALLGALGMFALLRRCR